MVDEALALVEKTGFRFYEAELHRLQGELLLKQAAALDLADDLFQQDLKALTGDNPDDLAKGQGIPLGIGKNSVIEGALIDKNARIGKDVIIKPFPHNTELDKDEYFVRDGVVVIPKRAVIHSGTVIAPEKPAE